MTRLIRSLPASALVLLAGCSTITDLWSGGPREQPRVRPDVIQLACDAGKSLQVRRDGDRAMWIVLPDREFRLDRVEGEGERYSNGRTTLTIKGDATFVEEAGTPTFSGCKSG